MPNFKIVMRNIIDEENIIDADYEIVNEDGTTTEMFVTANKDKVKLYRTMRDVIEEAKNLPERKQLYKEFWHENEICILFAEQGKGKTILAMQIANEISKDEKVLFLDYEMGDKQLFNRYSERGISFNFNDNFIHPKDKDIFFETDRERNIINYIIRMNKLFGIKIIIIDNISALSYQLESSGAMIKLMSSLNKIKKELGISVLLLGHTKKRNKKEPIIDNDLSGSKKLIALVDSAFAINSSINNEKLLYIKQIKCRECEVKYGADNVITCFVEKFDSFLQLVETGFDREENLLDKNSGGLSKAQLFKVIYEQHVLGHSNREIAKELNLSEGTIRNYLKQIKEAKTPEAQQVVQRFSACVDYMSN